MIRFRAKNLGYKLLDFEAIAQYFDGLHVTENAANRIMGGWDIYSTVWFNTSALAPVTMMKVQQGDGEHGDTELIPLQKNNHLVEN